MEKLSLIADEHKEHLRSELAEKMENPVKIVMFTQEIECNFCAQTRQLIGELAALSGKIRVELFDFVADSEHAKQFGVDKVPALVIMGEKDYGMRFYGFPFGYEFRTLIDALVDVSRGKTGLMEETTRKLGEISVPVHIQVFVTLTCPHCSSAAATAYKFAMENDLIRADVIDANEFPHLALRYGVMGVPKIVINERVEFVGAVPENLFLEQLLQAVR